MAQTYLTDILHVVAQWLMVPDIILLLLFIAYALFCIGSVLAEFFTERKHFNVVMPKFLSSLMEADEADIPDVIQGSGLLNRQKEALLTVYEYRTLPGDALLALIKRLMNEEESRYDRVVGRNNTAARVAPMLGLMGTLIPLGPGIEALGRADPTALSSSLLVAFDTTIAGLVVAAVCLVIGKIRSNWYDNYMSALDSAMATMLEKIEETQRPVQTGAMPNVKPVPVSAGTSSGRPSDSAYASLKAASSRPSASEFEQRLNLDPMPEFNPKSRPVSEFADAVAAEKNATQSKRQPVKESQAPITFSFEPLKDPLENQSERW